VDEDYNFNILILYSISIYSIKQVILKSLIIIMRILYILLHNFHKQQVTTYCLHKSVRFCLSIYIIDVHGGDIYRVSECPLFDLQGIYSQSQISPLFQFKGFIHGQIDFLILLQGQTNLPYSI